VLAGADDRAAVDTAHSLADRLGATVSAKNYGVDLLIVGSRPEAADGRVMISSQAENAVDQATCPVLVIARGVPLDFASPIYVS
jgi:nucleotide-binding universal stress UspA family protein